MSYVLRFAPPSDVASHRRDAERQTGRTFATATVGYRFDDPLARGLEPAASVTASLRDSKAAHTLMKPVRQATRRAGSTDEN